MNAIHGMCAENQQSISDDEIFNSAESGQV